MWTHIGDGVTVNLPELLVFVGGLGVLWGLWKLFQRESYRGRDEAMNEQAAILRCSFCNKDQNEVRALIAGPMVFICSECVEVCNDIVSGKFDNPSASDERIAIASPLNWQEMTKCPTCGHMSPSEGPGRRY